MTPIQDSTEWTTTDATKYRDRWFSHVNELGKLGHTASSREQLTQLLDAQAELLTLIDEITESEFDEEPAEYDGYDLRDDRP